MFFYLIPLEYRAHSTAFVMSHSNVLFLKVNHLTSALASHILVVYSRLPGSLVCLRLFHVEEGCEFHTGNTFNARVVCA